MSREVQPSDQIPAGPEEKLEKMIDSLIKANSTLKRRRQLLIDISAPPVNEKTRVNFQEVLFMFCEWQFSVMRAGPECDCRVQRAD